MMAIATARAHTGRACVMGMRGGYHGGVLYFAAPELPTNAPFPYLMGRFNDTDYCRELIRKHGDEIACVLLEPMLGSAGCVPARAEFLAMLREETAVRGIVLIFDEVMTSRLAAGGLQERFQVIPDLTTLGKYVGGGVTFGAFGGRAELMDLYDPRRADALPHAGTFNNNVLTMNSGLAGLAEVYPKEAAAPFNARGDALRERLNGLCRACGVKVHFTGLGSMMSIQFRGGEVTSWEDAQEGNAALRPLLHFDMLARGIYMARRGMINLMLPMRDQDLDALSAAFEEFFASRAGLLNA